MDEDFKYFYETKQFGPAIQSAPVPEASFLKYQGKLPDQLLDYWRTYGWCGFAEGLFWMVNPEAYAPVVDIWLNGTGFNDDDDFHIIARSAFGELFLWSEQAGDCLSINPYFALMFPNSVERQRARIKAGKADTMIRWFFSNQDKKSLECKDEKEKPMFERARKALGPLEKSEMYGFRSCPATRRRIGCRPTCAKSVQSNIW